MTETTPISPKHATDLRLRIALDRCKAQLDHSHDWDDEDALFRAGDVRILIEAIEAPTSETERLRRSAQEWAAVAELWMNEHDRLVAFIRSDPERLKALHAWAGTACASSKL